MPSLWRLLSEGVLHYTYTGSDYNRLLHGRMSSIRVFAGCLALYSGYSDSGALVPLRRCVQKHSDGAFGSRVLSVSVLTHLQKQCDVSYVNLLSGRY